MDTRIDDYYWFKMIREKYQWLFSYLKWVKGVLMKKVTSQHSLRLFQKTLFEKMKRE